MSVNEQKWSSKSTWLKFNGIDDTVSTDFLPNVPLMGNFTTTTSISISRGAIRRAVENDYTEIDKPLDTSIAYCGLGIESPYSTIKYYNTKTFELVAADNNNVTDFAFCSYSNLNTNVNVFTRQATGTTASNYTQDMANYIWSFDNKSTPVGITSNIGDIVPMVQFNLKNFVLVIRVKAKTTKYTTNSNDFVEEDLETYISTHTQTHPYIVGVSARVRYASAESESRNGATRYRWGVLKFSPRSLKWKDINGTEHGNYVTYQDLLCPFIQGSILVWGGSLQQILDSQREYGYTSKTSDSGYYRHQPILGDMTVETYDNKLFWYHEYNETTYEKIMKAVACFGLFFTPSNDVGISGELTDNNMYMGVLEDGIGHGKYTQGVLNPRNKQWDWNSSGDSDYKPGGGSKPYDAKTTAHRRIAPQGVAGQWYCLPLFSLDDTATWFQRIMTTINSTQTAEENNFYGQNPIDCILEAREVYLPQSFAGWDTTASVLVGDLIINSGELPNVRKSSFIAPINYDCGTIHIDEIYGDFRDYEPYTQIQLYIPFCGIVDLKPSVCTGHDITLEEEIEFTTGDILANIYVDNCLYTTINGNCASDMSLNGLAISNYAQIRSSYLQKGASDLLSAGASAISGIAGGTIAASYGNTAGVKAQQWAGGLTAAQGIISAIHDFDMYSNLHPAPIKIQNGSPSPQSNSVFNPFIIVQYPLEFDNFDISEFIKLNGVACYDTGKLSDIAKGITVCSEYDLSGIHCTEEEKQMIAHLLESGVIV